MTYSRAAILFSLCLILSGLQACATLEAPESAIKEDQPFPDLREATQKPEPETKPLTPQEQARAIEELNRRKN